LKNSKIINSKMSSQSDPPLLGGDYKSHFQKIYQADIQSLHEGSCLPSNLSSPQIGNNANFNTQNKNETNDMFDTVCGSKRKSTFIFNQGQANKFKPS